MKTMINKFLIVLQNWEGDKLAALRLAHHLADLEKSHCEGADFLFVSRFDCSHDLPTIQDVSRKFNTHHYRSPKQGTGWPHGCNELWFGAMEWVYHMICSGKIPHYKAVFTIEADGLPLVADWIPRLSKQWDELNAIRPVYVAGSILNPGIVGEHVNGQAFFSCDTKFLHWIVKQVGGVPPQVGWDYYLGTSFKKWGWASMPGLHCYWNTPTMTEERYKQERDNNTIWIHGVKDSSLYTMTRRRLLNV